MRRYSINGLLLVISAVAIGMATVRWVTTYFVLVSSIAFSFATFAMLLVPACMLFSQPRMDQLHPRANPGWTCLLALFVSSAFLMLIVFVLGVLVC